MIVAGVVIVVLSAGAGAASGLGLLGGSPSASTSPSGVAAVTPSPGTPSAAPTSTPGATAKTAPPTPSITAIPIVPAADWRSSADSIGTTDLTAIVQGRHPRWKTVEVVAGEEDAVLAVLGDPGRVIGERTVTAPDAATLMADLAAHRDRMGFMRADSVGPGVRALGWDGASLFGIHRLKSLDGWKLMAQLLPVPPDPVAGFTAYDPATTASVFAGGDLGYDRTVALLVTNLGFGVDYPYAGGTAKITGTYCCSNFNWPLPVIASTGGKGAMRDLIGSADLAVANSEEPAADHWTFHSSGTVFTGNPALLAGVANAGFDVVSCGSNHIGDAGKAGVTQTIANLASHGLHAFGCGANLDAARKPAVVDVNGTKIAILSYDEVPPKSYWATATTAGSAPLLADYVKADVAAARAAGAQVVIIYPHWGNEYVFGPTAAQEDMAHVMIDAGADLVIGNHGHWVQSIEIYKGKPIWYALGNFTFDQGWSEPTLEGISLELTFRSGTLVQARMNPHVLVKSTQPNLLDATSGWQRVLNPVFKASGSLLSW
jgi:hypothetical protein